MRPILYLTSCLVATSLAAPTFFDDAYNYSDEMAEFLGKVSQHIHGDVKDLLHKATTCDPSSIALPSHASGLPPPDDQKPAYVAVGRGTQNYTCADSTSNSKPEAVGAVARLYNATCIAANYPDVIHTLPGLAYKLTLPPGDADPLPPANIDLLGYHFFESKVPIFDLDTTVSRKFGVARTKKVSDIDAPSDAIQGENGAVAWLYLETVDGTIGGYSGVYRVDTVGGSAPKTCEGMESSFTVQYAANYYLYKS
ncbi:uncharacterized protein BDW47DRAFT_105011 [Aspergillus candidus]|uniref:Malate dehydrogenase n=1 Tax=Aspergillus candidus TaxID=41067 RepID=A0A2I2FD14_ASPCN|nr:hypothetical protein BDW47DRAFT_105011 [Aspergillus candidus]PLB38536.1 hypothetical protein BDW47DRAFT_105011 [Aspergillus candidus]